MSWLRDRINNSGKLFYTAVDPADFYEWKVVGQIPKGTRFSLTLPPSEIFTKGQIVASADLPPESIKLIANQMFELTADVSAEVNFQVGAVLSPIELLNKFHQMKDKFSKDTNHFRTVSLAQTFVINPLNKKVYKVTESSGRAAIDEYETFDHILKQLTAARRALTQDSMKKKGRAYELEQLRRFESAFVRINNKDTIVEPKDVAEAFRLANITPERTLILSWQDYYTLLSSEAKERLERIATMSSLTWIKEAEALS